MPRIENQSTHDGSSPNASPAPQNDRLTTSHAHHAMARCQSKALRLACHVKRLSNLVRNLQMQGEILQLSPKARRCHNKTRESKPDMLEGQKEHFARDVLKFSYFVATKPSFAPQIDVSCDVSANSHHMSQDATPDTEFAGCDQLTWPSQCGSQKTRNTARLKCCACHEKMSAEASLPRKIRVIF